MPSTEQISPTDARASGRNINAGWVPRLAITSAAMVEAIAMVAIMAPQ